MWIESEKGDLYNIDHVASIKLHKVTSNDVTTWYIVIPDATLMTAQSEAEAKKALQVIKDRIKNQVKIIDFSSIKGRVV